MPVNDDDMPFSSAPGRERYLSSSRNAQLSDMFEALLPMNSACRTFDLFTPLSSNPAWEKMYLPGDGVHPVGDGYAIVAEEVIGWDAWRAWFDK
jgi:lysophospholipase L1-like esterase